MQHVPIALFVLAAPIGLGVAFLLWALFRLELEKRSHHNAAAHPAAHPAEFLRWPH